MEEEEKEEEDHRIRSQAGPLSHLLEMLDGYFWNALFGETHSSM